MILRTTATALILAALTAPASSAPADRVAVVARPPASGANRSYTCRRPPLVPNRLIRLPVGAVRPRGWLATQLTLMASGFTGRLPELSGFCKFEGNAWVSPGGKGEFGWEEVPYWLKGYGDLGYLLDDRRIIAEFEKWINGITSTARPSGYLGPQSNLDAMDLWPNMPAMHALRTYYEAKRDPRVIKLMSAYFRWVNSLPLEQILPDSWQKVRGGDMLDSVYWLYDHTGEKWLLGLARVLHERTSDWTGGIASWHGVNFAQCFREPAQYYQQTRDPRYLNAAIRNYDELIGAYGQVPGGMYGADENCRPGYTGPRQAAETCAMVEMMHSHEMLTAITGEGLWADRCEDVAFNSLPASMTPDLKGLHYLTAPNQIQLDAQNKAPMVENGGEMFSYNPHGYRCCQHNAAFGWPYFTESLWMATRDNGLAAVIYAPCRLKATVGEGKQITVTEDTGYPFDESIRLTMSCSEATRFPLYLRIPGWCDAPEVSTNGKALKLPARPRGWILIDRKWNRDDWVELKLPMSVRLKFWERNGNSVSVYRGPLAYSLKIGERWHSYGGTERWPAHEVYPTTPWNYGLVVDKANPAACFSVAARAVAEQPFTPDAAPLEIRARARRIRQWRQEANGMIGEIRQSPVLSDAPEEEVVLIPMGCARLRVSAFPWIGSGPDAKAWPEWSVERSASHVCDTLTALDDLMPIRSSHDTTIPRFTWWPHLGTPEWVQYTFSKPISVSWCEVYWYDDEPAGSVRPPAAWKVVYWDGSAWQPVRNRSGYPADKGTFNRVRFEEIQTTMLRLEVQLKPGFSAGILEWAVGE